MVKHTPGRPSATTVVAMTALVAALAGSAYAAVKIDTADIMRRAVTSQKIAPAAVKTKKIADSAVTTEKISNGAVNAAQIADGSVTATELTPNERSQGFEINNAGQVAVPANTRTTVASLTLPAGGSYVITAVTSLGNSASNPGLVSCELHDDDTTLTAGDGDLTPQPVFSEQISLTATSDGGVITLVCDSDVAATARHRVITAIRVGSVN